MSERIKIVETKILSDGKYKYKKVTFDHQDFDGTWKRSSHEVLDRGNAACVLLYNLERKTVILTQQIRLPAFLNGQESGMLIEACAGVQDDESPETCIIRETEEETGYRIQKPQKVFEVYMSPGAVTELLYFYVADYSKADKVSEGGGLKSESEDIRVLEIPIAQAKAMMESGEICDAKTIILLQYAMINIF